MSDGNEEMQPVWVGGCWRPASAAGAFQATNPSNLQLLAPHFPLSTWSDLDEALDAAVKAHRQLRSLPVEKIAVFLESYAALIEQAKESLVEAAHEETGLPRAPRLADVELPRTTAQMRMGAAAARRGDWAMATIDTVAGIRSCYQSLGPVCVFGPNNFPFAFNSIAGGDFVAAIAAGNPVIAKANSSHPRTTQLFAELAAKGLDQAGLPRSSVQLIYRTSHEDGERLVSDPRCGATGYTGSRHAGLALKRAADRAGKPIYLELSSVNPVVITRGALVDAGDAILEQYVSSVLMGTGQFCTNPGLVLMLQCPETEAFVDKLAQRFQSAPVGTLLSPAVTRSLSAAVTTLIDRGARILSGGAQPEAGRCALANTLLRCTAEEFLADSEGFQTEAFGNAALLVVARNEDELFRVLGQLEGNLTGSIYSARDDHEEALYQRVADLLAMKVGRLLNDKMPTGVAVSPAMNHGGPYPATGHPGFTAVGIPASMLRFAKLTCFDNVRHDRLPLLLRDPNPTGQTWRSVDGGWTTAPIKH